MKTTVLGLPVLLLSLLSTAASAQGAAQSPAKVGIIYIQNAIAGTNDGKKAIGDLQAKFAPKKNELDKVAQQIEAAKAQLSRGANTMNAEQKEKLMRQIDQMTKSLNRDAEDAQAELDQEQGKLMQELGQRMLAVIDKYAKDNGYSLILDVSSQQTPVLWAATAIDITNEIIQLYDKNASAGARAPAAAASAAPASSVPAAPPAKALPPAAR